MIGKACEAGRSGPGTRAMERMLPRDHLLRRVAQTGGTQRDVERQQMFLRRVVLPCVRSAGLIAQQIRILDLGQGRIEPASELVHVFCKACWKARWARQRI